MRIWLKCSVQGGGGGGECCVFTLTAEVGILRDTCGKVFFPGIGFLCLDRVLWFLCDVPRGSSDVWGGGREHSVSTWEEETT